MAMVYRNEKNEMVYSSYERQTFIFSVAGMNSLETAIFEAPQGVQMKVKFSTDTDSAWYILLTKHSPSQADLWMDEHGFARSGIGAVRGLLRTLAAGGYQVEVTLE